MIVFDSNSGIEPQSVFAKLAPGVDTEANRPDSAMLSACIGIGEAPAEVLGAVAPRSAGAGGEGPKSIVLNISMGLSPVDVEYPELCPLTPGNISSIADKKLLDGC